MPSLLSRGNEAVLECVPEIEWPVTSLITCFFTRSVEGGKAGSGFLTNDWTFVFNSLFSDLVRD